MTYIESVIQRIDNVSFDAAGKQRVSQGTTLLDGKILNQDNTLVWDNVGTGTGTWTANKYSMSVTAGQYMIRQTKRFYPYFAGKSQKMVLTYDNFQLEVGVIKRVGYFSSSIAAPYTAAYDGLWLESNGDTSQFTFNVFRNGVSVISAVIDEPGYNWANFTVTEIDFLWLGGAACRVFLVFNGEFKLEYNMLYPGTAADTFISSPNQPIRYEVRSTTGAGSFRYICSELTTEGSINESGYGNSVRNATAITANTVNTIYVLKGIRKKTTHRDSPVRINNFIVNITASVDSGLAMLVINPTLSAPITWADVANSPAQEGTATNQTVTALGRVIATFPVTQFSGQSLVQDDFLSWLSDSVTGTRDEYYLVYQPTSANQTVNGIINFKEY